MLYDADLCRQRGWEPGTRLLLTEPNGKKELHLITAVGLRKILSTMLAYQYPGEPWTDITNPACWETAGLLDLSKVDGEPANITTI